ncbi:RHS repeat-associated core domain-containing protein [Catelliglobosispora koreensis]|uniref:RHS repeat-associated core domain-containing protein n=1 Tax=Catelliglobosispora koreensis TaxID=129052 RepID=UPI0003801D0B|nr:RHS repeat-associated core domain-containing protein [Catelliglobosispora koreensis]
MRRNRWLSAALSAFICVPLVAAIGSAQATAAVPGPTVSLPEVPSTPVTGQTMGAVPQDQASAKALTGNQPVQTTPPQDGSGNATATSLSPSASWSVSGHTGDFTWSYPLQVPPSASGVKPQLALSYASSSADGRTSATNNQPSWVGEGWDLSPGFIERVYGPCAEDDGDGTVAPKVGDLCWRSDNAIAAFAGKGGQLIHRPTNDNRSIWQAKSDDGDLIERHTNANNGDNNGEYWTITTTDGTTYYFGSRSEAQSAWTVPVFGDDANEPCHGATFDTSWCQQVWRWQVDKMVDRNGNIILFNYRKEWNKYGLNNKDAAVPYVRGGSLEAISYGLRDNVPASGWVEFAVADRCVPGSDCTPSKKENWPDTQWEQQCDAETCPGKNSPSFFSSKRLATITTKVLRDGTPTAVDSWKLEHSFPNPDGGEKAALWLKSIVHTGHVGGTINLPAVTFGGTKMPNRVAVGDGYAALSRYRITGITSESGGQITIRYANPNCTTSSPTPAEAPTNTLRCFPVRWAKPGHVERVDYFHKYVVDTVTESDRFQGMRDQLTRYEYLDGAAWHLDTSEFTKPDKRLHNEYRGYGKVLITGGASSDPAGTQSRTEKRFYRGMERDEVVDSENGRRADSDWLTGFEFESITYQNAAVVSKTISTPWSRGPLASRGDLKSYIVRSGGSSTYTKLESGWQITRTTNDYDDLGLLTETDDLGDTRTADDDRCTTYTYVRNPAKWLMALRQRTETVAVNCDGTVVYPKHAISDVRVAFDGKDFGAAPTAGNPTRVESLKDRQAGALPVYELDSTTEYDVLGRPVKNADALGRATTITYEPQFAGPVTKVIAKNPLNHTTTTELEVAWGVPKKVTDPNGRLTETAYDALGRVTNVWLPNRKRPAASNYKYTYMIRQDKPTIVTSSKLNAKGTYTVTKTLYDGLLRARQVQAEAMGGGRLLTDTQYDSQGRIYKSTTPYFHNAPLDTDENNTIWVPSDADKVGVTTTSYDGAGRPVLEVFHAATEEKWRTSMVYAGDRVHVTPPAGGIATTIISNARGQKIELRQYHGGQPTGAYDSTTYSYTKAGQPETVVGATGNTWRYGYDLGGQLTSSQDADKGAGYATYDEAGQVTSRTDALGNTLLFSYDNAGRRTEMKLATPNEPQLLSRWTYDTADYGAGLPASSTHYVNGAEYTTTIKGYNAFNQPIETTTSIPETPEAPELAGTYTTGMGYKPDGSIASIALPQIGTLPAETINYQYGDHGQLISSSGGYDGKTFKYVTDSSYTRFGELQRMQFGEGDKRVWQTYLYEDHTRLLKRSVLDAEVANPNQSDVKYQRDAAGNITSIADAPFGAQADLQCFRYDYLRRLTDAWTPGTDCATAPESTPITGPAPYRQSFSYDAAGNRLSETTTNSSGTQKKVFEYPTHGVSTMAVAGVNSSYTYDAAGNMKTRPGQTLDWDAEGNLTSVSGASGNTSFVYSAEGSRLTRQDSAGTTLYLGSQEVRVDAATRKVSPVRYYQHGDKTVAVRAGHDLHWLAGDHQQTAQKAINASDLGVVTRRQTPFGGNRGTAAAFPSETGFVGGTNDRSTGLVHIGARDYDPALGRFISVDPIMNADDPQQHNGYAYANNTPVTLADPTGLMGSCPDGVCNRNTCQACADNRKQAQAIKEQVSAKKAAVRKVWGPHMRSYEYETNARETAYLAALRDAKLTATVNAWGAHFKDFKREKEMQTRSHEKEYLTEQREKQEHKACRADFWCSKGDNFTNNVNDLSKITDSKAFKLIAIGLGIAGLFACPPCGLLGMIGLGMSALGTSVSCYQGKSFECGFGVASLGLGAAGGALVKGGRESIKTGRELVANGRWTRPGSGWYKGNAKIAVGFGAFGASVPYIGSNLGIDGTGVFCGEECLRSGFRRPPGERAYP